MIHLTRRVARLFQIGALEKLILQDHRHAFTLFSYATVFGIYVNLNLFMSPALGVLAFIPYFLINGIFLANALFRREQILFRFTLGFLSLLMLLGFVGWAIMVIYSLDILASTLTLFIVATLSSLLKRRLARIENEDPEMPRVDQKPVILLRIGEILCLVLIFCSFYLLSISRTAEAQTVWQALNPVSIPALFATAFVILGILFSREKTTYKLLFVILYSVLIHLLFSLIFPTGDTLSGQQMVLGRTRRVFDNTIQHGLTGWPNQSIAIFVYEAFQGINLQAALTTILARMFLVDIFYVHLAFIPILWGVFVPFAAFIATKTLTNDENVSVLSSLLISVFPYATYFGAISVPNSLGFIFFFYSLCFMLKYVSSNSNPRTAYIAIVFSFFSFLSHYLTGIMSFSLLLLTALLKAYMGEKGQKSSTTRYHLLLVFLICASLLPLAFTYLRFLDPLSNVSFALDRLYELPLDQVVGLLLLGELAYGFDYRSIILIMIGSVIAFFYMIYLFYRTKRNRGKGLTTSHLLLSLAFLIVLVDYEILNLFMQGLPINAERLWVLRDFIATPFVATAIYSLVTYLKTSLRLISPLKVSVVFLKAPPRKRMSLALGLFFSLNVLVPTILGGWLTFSLGAAYPRVAPYQTTRYELEAAKYIKGNTLENYVVIGDIWAVYAGEVIVGISNPEAFYFSEFDRTREDLFQRMLNETSVQVMVDAMDHTGVETAVAYFIISKIRLETREYDRIIQQALQNDLQTFQVFHNPEGEEKVRIFYFEKTFPTSSQK